MSWDPITKQALPSRQVTHFHLLRHGRVDTGGQRRAYGHTDYPIDAEGQRQTDALIGFVASGLPRPAGVLSSDLVRCTALAQPLAQRLGVELRVSPALREQHMGDWEGVPWSVLTERDLSGVQAYWADYLDTRPPGGESYQETAQRVYGFLAAQDALLAGRRWVIVTHVGVIRAIACRMLGVPLSEALRFTPMPGTHSWFLQAEAGAVLQVLGERPPSVSAPVEAAPRPGAPPSSSFCLALSGSAGTGKTTLARALARHLDVPYVPEGMRERIEAGLDLHRLGRSGLRELICDLMRQQRRREDEAHEAHGGFVSDRSPLDHAAFWLTYGFASDPVATAAFFAEVRTHLARYDQVVVLPWGVLPLEADGVRTPNPWIQRHFQATVEGLLYRELPGARLRRLPPLISQEARLSWVLDGLPHD